MKRYSCRFSLTNYCYIIILTYLAAKTSNFHNTFLSTDTDEKHVLSHILHVLEYTTMQIYNQLK